MRATLNTAIATPPARSLSRPSAPAKTQTESLLRRILPRRQKPTLFQRCLAVHMADAGKMSALR